MRGFASSWSGFLQGGGVILDSMARSPRDLKRLADELAALTPEDRARVLAEVRTRQAPRPLPKDFHPPILKASGGRWIGGDLRRESIYGDDGR